jgi:hypothetical protein
LLLELVAQVQYLNLKMVTMVRIVLLLIQALYTQLGVKKDFKIAAVLQVVAELAVLAVLAGLLVKVEQEVMGKVFQLVRVAVLEDMDAALGVGAVPKEEMVQLTLSVGKLV